MLYRESIDAAHKQQAGLDQGREMQGEDHQYLRLNFFSLKKNDAFALTRLRDARCFGGAFGCFAIAPATFAFLVDIGRKISGLTQLADRFVSRSRFDQPGGFLSAGIERYVSETRHKVMATDLHRLKHISAGICERSLFICGFRCTSALLRS